MFPPVLHRRHPALPLEELPEGRLVAEAQHLGHLLHGEGRVTQADFGFTDKQGRQDAACRASVCPLQGGGEGVGRDAYLPGIPRHFVLLAAMGLGQVEEVRGDVVPMRVARRAPVLVLPVEGVPHLVLPGAGQGLQLFAEERPPFPCQQVVNQLGQQPDTTGGGLVPSRERGLGKVLHAVRYLVAYRPGAFHEETLLDYHQMGVKASGAESLFYLLSTLKAKE